MNEMNEENKDDKDLIFNSPKNAFEEDGEFPEEGEGLGGRKSSGSGRSSKKSKTQALDSFSRDLTDLAKQGKLDPVIGRDVELDMVIQILNKRKKNNPIIIGEPGIGKCFCKESLVTLRNDITGKITEISVEDFVKTLPIS